LSDDTDDPFLQLPRAGQDEATAEFFRASHKKASFTRDNLMRGWNISYIQLYKLQEQVDTEIKDALLIRVSFKGDDAILGREGVAREA
jgi:hypothetical protein